MFPEVIQVLPGDDFTAYVYFADGQIRLFDAKPLIEAGGVFEQIRDETRFRETMTVMNSTLSWDPDGSRNEAKSLDIDPYVIYLESPAARDPLERAM